MFRSARNALLISLASSLCIMVIGPARVVGDLPWKEVDGIRIPVPPPAHPRLYLRPEHVSALRSRQENRQLRPVVERLEDLAGRSELFGLEWDAVNYLIDKDPELGRRTVESTLTFLQKAKLPDRQDGARVTGRAMVTGAIVYDWLYPLLTPKEKEAYIRELIRLAKTLESGYPPVRQGSVTGHSSEAMIMRDMLSAGIAIYDEFPEMYDLAAGRFFREHLPARNWLYAGHAYHQGDSYGPYRFGWDTFPLWIFDRLGAGNVYNPAQSQVGYLWIYNTRPDGQRLRSGDTFMHSRSRGTPWGVGPGIMLAASYYGDGTLLSHYLDQQGNRDNELLFEFLWRDIKLQPKPIAALPTSRYFGSPFGWMVARTGWDENSVLAQMKINEYNFVNHQHLDAGAFQIYYRGALAIDSGVYGGSSGKYGSPHCRNYYWRTIAHNTLLIHDPDEEFAPDKGYGNDGGQRLPNRRSEPQNLDMLLDPANGYRTGSVLARGMGPDSANPDFTWLKGDITDAYSNKTRAVQRSFVFINLRNDETPAALIVFDRIVASDAEFKKSWLIHSLEEPQVSDHAVTIDRTEYGETGRLVLTPLLPKTGDRRIEKIGGPGREFWVFGENFANDQEPGDEARTSKEIGKWRIEISPKHPAQENLMLHAMQVTTHTGGTTLPVTLVDDGLLIGCRIDGPDEDWLVLFRSDGRQGDGPISFECQGDQPCHALITDLSAGTWQAQRGEDDPVTIEVTEESAAALLRAGPGRWRLSR